MRKLSAATFSAIALMALAIDRAEEARKHETKRKKPTKAEKKAAKKANRRTP